MKKTLYTKLIIFFSINFFMHPFLNCGHKYYTKQKNIRKKYKYNKNKKIYNKERKFKNKLRNKKEKKIENSTKKEHKFISKLVNGLGASFILSCFLNSVNSKDIATIPDCKPGIYLLVMIGNSNTWMGTTSCFCIPDSLNNLLYLKCSLRLSEKKAVKDYEKSCEPGIYRVYVEYPGAIIKTTRACTCKKALFGKTIYLDCNDNPLANFEIIPNDEICDPRRSIIPKNNIDADLACKKCCEMKEFINKTLTKESKLPYTQCNSLCDIKTQSSNLAPLIGTAIGSSIATSGCLLVFAGVAVASGVIYYKFKKYKSKKNYKNTTDIPIALSTSTKSIDSTTSEKSSSSFTNTSNFTSDFDKDYASSTIL